MHRYDIVSNVANRWEAHAALAFMLTEAILGLIRDDSIRHEHGDHIAREKLIQWLWDGSSGDSEAAGEAQPKEGNFGGLAQILSCGEVTEQTTPLYDLSVWAAESPYENLTEWLSNGTDIMVKQYESSIYEAKHLRDNLRSMKDHKKTSVVIEEIAKLSKCLCAPVSLLDRGRGILETVAGLNAVSVLQAKYLQVLQVPLQHLKRLLNKNDMLAFFHTKCEEFRCYASSEDEGQGGDAMAAAALAFCDEIGRVYDLVEVTLSKANSKHFEQLGNTCVKQGLLDNDTWKRIEKSFNSISHAQLEMVKEVVRILLSNAAGQTALEDSIKSFIEKKAINCRQEKVDRAQVRAAPQIGSETTGGSNDDGSTEGEGSPSTLKGIISFEIDAITKRIKEIEEELKETKKIMETKAPDGFVDEFSAVQASQHPSSADYHAP